MQKGFSLLELVITVAIISILAAIGVPQYLGYSGNAKASTAKDALRAIYLQQQEYYQNNGSFFTNGTDDCSSDTTNEMNTTLFNGKNVLISGDYDYCVMQDTADDFIAYAKENGGDREVYSIDHNNTTSF